MTLPFFDLDSSAEYLRELLSEVEPAFISVAITGSHARDLARRLDGSFQSVVATEQDADVVVSWDEIHLLPATQRREFVAECAKRAKRELLIACPLGTELQAMIYASLAKHCRELDLPVPAELGSALTHGLPDPVDAASWAHGFSDFDLFYAGDVTYFQHQATRFLVDAASSPLRKLLLKLPSANAPSQAEEPLPPETVPMRRHRRLFLLIRKR
ncbi:MAG: hypothetical protein H6506_02995 [Calditrichaeota bacterium]|nr:hypothetical protein [Calditrichota bacterium]MCB9391602.1 hypothetical protein [Calditrichota bacterium]